MKNYRFTKLVCIIIGVLLYFTPQLGISQINHALTAVASHSGGGATIYDASNYNDDIITLPTGLPWGWVSTNGWIEYTWTNPVSINALVFYKDNRPMTTATLQYWDGTNYVNFFSYNSSITPKDSISFPTITTTRLRIDSVAGSGNPNHREIQALFVSSAPNDASLASVDSPRVFCAGFHNVVVTVRNQGTNQIDSLDVAWEVNGVAQPTILFRQLLDTISGLNPSSAQINLGSASFNAGSNNIKAWTFNPNGGADTVNTNDTANVVVTSAAAPLETQILNSTLTSAQINAVGGAGTVEYEYGLFGFTLGTGTSGSSPTSLFTISGLQQGTTYDVYVRSNCGGSDVSAWVGPETFNTSYGIPFFQDFENFQSNFTATTWPEGWTSIRTANPRWTSRAGTTPSVNTGPDFDHTLGTSSGTYVHLEATGSPGDFDEFYSPPIFVDSSLQAVELSFWYHMYGSTMGELMVIVDTNGVQDTLLTIVGQQQIAGSDPWQEASAFITGYAGKSIQLIFKGIRGSNYFSDMSIDDVRLDPVVQLNAKVNELVNPSGSLCPGNITPEVQIENAGSDTITTVDVVLDVNGVLDTVTFNGALGTGGIANITFPAITISSGIVYNIEAYTMDPNGLPDMFQADDTLRITNLSTGLFGTATVDPSLPATASNFQSFAALANQLNTVGICGNVTVTVAPGTYNEVISLETIPGADSVNTLTIDGVDSSLVIVENNFSSDNAMLRFNGTQYVTVKNMTLRSTYTATAVHFGVHFMGGARHDSVVNCRVLLNPAVTSANSIGIGASSTTTSGTSTGDNANFVTVMNSEVIGGYYGVRFYAAGTGNYNVGNSFINNHFSLQHYYGFYVLDQDSLSIIGNRIENLRNTTTHGIYLFRPMNFKVRENYAICNNYPLYISSANSYNIAEVTAEVINNMLISNSSYGMYLLTPVNVNIFHNSVLAEGGSEAFYFTSTFADSLDVRNNIFSSNSAPAMRTTGVDSTVFLKLDNNVYHTTSSANLLNINGTLYPTLADYQAAQSNFDIRSLEGDPQFLSNTDLHIVGSFVNNNGDNFTGVDIDIDGDPRPFPFSTDVDPGADEFDPPLCAPPLAIRAFNPGLDSVTIVVDGLNQEFEWEIVLGGAPQASGDTGIIFSDSVRVGDLTPSTTYDLYVREICGRGDTSVWLGPLTFSTANGIPYLEDFELFPEAITGNPWPKGWSSSTTVAPRWESDEATGANANSVDTGPFYDHTSEGVSGGMYLYLETSGGSLGSFADLISPPIYVNDTLTTVELSFWYHMYGQTMGDLVVMVDTNNVLDTLLVISGQQQTTGAEAWKSASVILNGYEGKSLRIIFRGVRGSNYYSDMSIDDVEIKPVLDNNTALVELISPGLPICPGNVQPVVGVRNNGSDTITTVDIVWDVNGVLDTLVYTGQILPGDTVPVTLGTVNINASTIYDIKFYTNNPNGIADELPADDTLSLDGLITGLVGNFTIDANQVTGSNNFESFTDFANAVNSFGVCGAIVVDVVVGSGPYIEQVLFESIEGVSATNTITINGHNETISFGSTNANQRAVVTINNSSWITIDSLQVTSTGGTYNWGIQNTNGAHHITIKNSVVDVGITGTSSVNVIGIANSGSPTSATTGSDLSHIVIDNNTIIGGYYSITNAGTSGIDNKHFEITNNNVLDFYAYGIYNLQLDSSVVSNNDVSRPNRTNTTTFYGVYASTCTNMQVNANAIHNSHDSQTTLTGAAYPIYVTGTTSSGSENVYTNNLIYNINNNGTIYGIYNLSISGNYFINNTVSLDYAAATGGITRGYFQSSTTGGTNTQFINNLISISRGGSGIKYGIYIANTTSPATIDYNNVYMNSLGSGGQSYGYQSADRVDLADWQANTNFGTNSHEEDPQYVDLANDDLMPNQALINAVALSTPLVTEDFYGVARATNPDIGAIEFDPPPIVNAGLNSLESPFVSADSCYTASENVIINILNAGGVSIDFSNDTGLVEVNITGAITTNLQVSINDNSRNGGLPLGLGNDFDVDMGIINMSSPGTYNIEAIISMPADSFPNNDTLRSTLVINPTSGGLIEGNDSICAGDTTELTTTNYQGELQWQEWDGTNWVDITGATGFGITVSPSTNTDYRVLACGTESSDTITVVPISLNAPTVLKNDSIVVICGIQGVDSLIMVNQPGIVMSWYDAPVDGNVVETGDTLIYSATPDSANPTASDTFYVAGSTGAQSDTLTSVGFTGGNSCGGGNMFNLLASKSLSISGLALNTTIAQGQPVPVDIYIKNGTYDGFQLNAGAWTLVASGTGTSAGANQPTEITLNNSINLTANQLTGMYVNFAASYTNIAANTLYSSADLDLFSGDGLCGLFTGNNVGRAFNGRLYIEGGCESPRTMVVGRVDCLVGLDDNELAETTSLSVYPNPSSGLFTLNINTEKQEQFVLTVRDVKGQTVYTGDVSVNGEYRNDLDFTGFAKGVYYLQIQTETATKVEKLIIQ